jgi:hypothetical protein
MILIISANVLSAISQITISHNKSKLAYTTDSGVVGVVDLATKHPTKMRVKHANVSPATTNIAFILTI